MPRHSPKFDTDLKLIEHDDGNRDAVEKFIRDRFFDDYRAKLTNLMPRLFSLSDASARMVASFGLREAAKSKLFMECYLDEPIEERIQRLTARKVLREHIIEVGNLAALPGGARSMIALLTRHLYELGFEWVTFTGVAVVRAAFLRLGLNPLVIAQATPDRLSAVERLAWGRYFESRPIVMAGHIPNGYRTLCRLEHGAPARPVCGEAVTP
jgi:hypothetical protein